MKNQFKGFISGVLVTLLLVGSIGTAAATVGTQTVQLNFNDIKVTLDGEAVALVDVNGDPVEPFIIDGTTYLPIRAISNAFGLEVGWDGATQTVILTHPNNVQPAPDPKPEPEPTPEPVASVAPIRGKDPNMIVYVSNKSNTIHSVSDCSGMKNYREMKLYEADAKGYDYCSNCW